MTAFVNSATTSCSKSGRYSGDPLCGGCQGCQGSTARSARGRLAQDAAVGPVHALLPGLPGLPGHPANSSKSETDRARSEWRGPVRGLPGTFEDNKGNFLICQGSTARAARGRSAQDAAVGPVRALLPGLTSRPRWSGFGRSSQGGQGGQGNWPTPPEREMKRIRCYDKAYHWSPAHSDQPRRSVPPRLAL